MASVIVVVIIFVLLALAILFICQNGGWQGGCGGNCASCHQMHRSGKEAEEITLASLCEGGGPAGPEGENPAIARNISGNRKVLSPTACGRSPLAEGAKNFAPLLQGELFSCPAVAQMHKNGYTYK